MNEHLSKAIPCCYTSDSRGFALYTKNTPTNAEVLLYAKSTVHSCG